MAASMAGAGRRHGPAEVERTTRRRARTAETRGGGRAAGRSGERVPAGMGLGYVEIENSAIL